MSAFIILGLLLLFLLLGIPIAFVMGGLGLALLMFKGFNPVMIPQALYSSIDSFILLAVPLFLLMSNILLKGGIGKDLFAAAQSWVGHWPGGLGVATILSCGLFAAISGSSVATAATIGTVAIPEMLKRGYEKSFIMGLLAAGGTLGILIPPSIILIIYGVAVEESIIGLFMAGVGPGLFLILMFSIYSVGYARFGGQLEVLPRASWEERRKATIGALPVLVLAAAIVLGIYFGVFTPTEAAGVGFVLALIITIGRGTLNWTKLKEASVEAMQTTVTIFLIIAGAKIFSKAITLYRIPQDVTRMVTENFTDVGMFLLVVCFILLVMGLFIESLSMLVIMVPVLYPALMTMGVDPIWFGIVFVIMIECALITPPVGLNLFVVQAVGNATLWEVSRGVWPFIIIMLGTVAVLYFFPALAMYLPLAF
ncbi:TRAP transporter large permease [Pseudooceanicola sp.]|mgnify:CR=1 FL=1|uniref:TRAP transporter large permease n=1 Tax=Pseudooceanicola sp. TaxID=1914328 RepID=UPI000C0936C8|nr:C4-dicarboxylate ABC transporter permease [Pseudooceanicola sp.]